MRLRLAWYLQFAWLNSVFFCIIQYRSLKHFFPLELIDTTWLGKALITLYIVITYIGYYGVIPWLFLVPFGAVVAWLPGQRLWRGIAIVAITITAIYFIADSFVFALYRYHINRTILQMFFSGEAQQMFAFNWREWVLMGGIVAAVLLLEAMLGNSAEGRIHQPLPRKWLLSLCGLLGFSYLTLLISMGYGISGFSQQAKAFPGYQTLLLRSLNIDPSVIEKFASGRFTQLKEAGGTLRYPLHKLQCKPPQQAPNILLIGVDSWRFDSLNANVTPHIYQFAQQNLQFTRHYSGGNATRSGLFSLFYGLPPSYWSAFLAAERGSLLLDALLAQNYRIGIFFSGEYTLPPFDKTLFAQVRQSMVEMSADTPLARDEEVTAHFKRFIAQSSQPWFSFLFYVTPHSYCLQQNLPTIFRPFQQSCNRVTRNNNTDPVPYFNRYRNALFATDQQINQVLTELKQQHLLDNTIVIITSDHGQEFNDNKRNYWEHAGNFSQYQLRVPLVIHWPGKAKKRFTHTSSHYDVIPTLLQDVLQCSNPSSDYSIGRSLWQTTDWLYLPVSSYVSSGFLEAERITTLHIDGSISIQDNELSPLPNAKLNIDLYKQLLQQQRKFFE